MLNTFLCILNEFQTLITGVLALIAAIITAVIIWKSSKLPLQIQQQLNKDLETRKKRYNLAVLKEDLRLISNRAEHAKATIKVTVAANANVNDKIREKVRLHLPKIIDSWEDMSLLDETLFNDILDLRRKIIDHNFDMERAGGAFGADNFRESINKRLDNIKDKSFHLSNNLPR